MTIKYTWRFPNADVIPGKDGKQDVVYRIHWRLLGSDDSGNFSEVYGVVNIPTADLTTFTEFQDLTHDQVQEWVEANLGTERVKELRLLVERKINEQVSPTSLTKTLNL